MRWHGFTLMEMMVVLVVDAALAGMALLVLVTAMRYQSDAGQETQCRASFTRLAEQFRADVHAAEGCQASDDSRGCQFRSAGGRRIEYRLEGEQVMRTVREHERFVARDAFALPPGARPAIDLPAAATGMVRLRVAAGKPAGAGQGRLNWCIEAALAPHAHWVVEESRP
jgi:prepilin-type N-terminal cleavage/methylation domain-containing protein